MIESRRFQAVDLLEERAAARIDAAINSQVLVAQKLHRVDNRKFWDLDTLTSVQRYFKRRNLRRLHDAFFEEQEQAGHELEIMHNLDSLSRLSVEVERRFGKNGYELTTTLVGRIADITMAIDVNKDKRVIDAYIKGEHMEGKSGKKYAQELFDAFYPIVSQRDRLESKLSLQK